LVPQGQAQVWVRCSVTVTLTGGCHGPGGAGTRPRSRRPGLGRTRCSWWAHDRWCLVGIGDHRQPKPLSALLSSALAGALGGCLLARLLEPVRGRRQGGVGRVAPQATLELGDRLVSHSLSARRRALSGSKSLVVSFELGDLAAQEGVLVLEHTDQRKQLLARGGLQSRWHGHHRA